MKKNLFLLSGLAFLMACGGENKSEYDQYYSRDGQGDSSAAAAISAAAKQSEVDTSLMNIGTDRSAGGAVENFENGAKLIASSDCLTCHQEKKKVVGPAYVDVAQKYEATDENIDYLAEKIIQGGKGVWGEIPMSPHPNLKEEDAKEMARYILSLN